MTLKYNEYLLLSLPNGPGLCVKHLILAFFKNKQNLNIFPFFIEKPVVLYTSITLLFSKIYFLNCKGIL